MKSIVISLLAVISFAAAPTVMHAQALPGPTPFGGTILVYVPPTPLCPVPHTLVFDIKTYSPLAIAALPGSQIYSFYNLFRSGAFVLGSTLPTPIPCLVPYKIYPIFQVGTSL